MAGLAKRQGDLSKSASGGETEDILDWTFTPDPNWLWHSPSDLPHDLVSQMRDLKLYPEAPSAVVQFGLPWPNRQGVIGASQSLEVGSGVSRVDGWLLATDSIVSLSFVRQSEVGEWTVRGSRKYFVAAGPLQVASMTFEDDVNRDDSNAEEGGDSFKWPEELEVLPRRLRAHLASSLQGPTYRNIYSYARGWRDEQRDMPGEKYFRIHGLWIGSEGVVALKAEKATTFGDELNPMQIRKGLEELRWEVQLCRGKVANSK